MYRYIRAYVPRAICGTTVRSSARLQPLAERQWKKYSWNWRRVQSKSAATGMLDVSVGVCATMMFGALLDETESRTAMCHRCYELDDPDDQLLKVLSDRDLAKLQQMIDTQCSFRIGVSDGSLIRECIMMGWHDAVELLLDKKFKMTEPILIFAIMTTGGRDISLVELICRKRPDLIGQKDRFGNTALEYALDGECFGVARVIMKYGLKV